MSPRGPVVSVVAPDGLGEVREGDDVAALLLDLLGPDALAEGDVVVVTSKIVSKAEGRVVAGARDDHLEAETARLVARRGPTSIVRTHHGLTLAAAGIDASNVARGHAVLLPVDPDASARRLRAALVGRTGRNLAVVITDTAGRAWREGQTDLAVGAAGLRVLEDFSGRLDPHGNELAVTAPAVADEIAGLAELAQGKLGARPLAVVTGLAHLVLARDDDGPGARALVRPEGADLFGFGAREAVVRAVRGDRGDLAPFGAPVSARELVDALARVVDRPLRVEAGEVVCAGPGPTVSGLDAVAFAHGWVRSPAAHDAHAAGGATDLRWRPATP